MDAMIEALINDYEADCGFVQQDKQDYHSWLDELEERGAMERERHCQAHTHPPRWGKRLSLPEGKQGLRTFADKLRKDMHEWQDKPTWPEGGPMTGTEDFTPEAI